MIHECYAEVTCDTCHNSTYVQLEYKYHSYSGNSGFHDSDDSAIEETLVHEQEWITEEGKHFCSQHCYEKKGK